MAPTFSIADRATWPDVLTADEVAAIFRLSVHTVNKKAQRGTFAPTPFQHWKPRRWRKADVCRYLDTPSAHLRRAS